MLSRIKTEIEILQASVKESYLTTFTMMCLTAMLYQFFAFFNYRRHYFDSEKQKQKTEQVDKIEAVNEEIIEVEENKVEEEEPVVFAEPKIDLRQWDYLRGKFKAGEVNASTRLTKNFILGEFLSKDGVMPNQKELDNIVISAHIFQIFRDYINSGNVQLEVGIVNAIHVNSAHRSAERNSQIKGAAEGSYHLVGMAIDFWVEGYSSDQSGQIMEHMMKYGLIPKGGLAVYSTHVHYDWRGYNARW